MLGSYKSNKVSFWVKSLIFLIIASTLFYILKSNEKLDELYWQAVVAGWKKNSSFLVIAFLLLPVNWFLEAYKWKFIVQDIEKISFKRATEGVIIGVSMGFVTPHSIGDYAARIFSLTNPERVNAIGAVFLCRISQFYITLCFGSISLVVYIYMVLQESGISYSLLVLVTFLNNILFVALFIFHKSILRYLLSRERTKKIFSYFAVIEKYTFKEINYVLLLSFLRYCVFCFQFVLILYFFEIDILWWLLVSGVAFVFFVKSIVPTFMDLGVRELAAVGFLGVFYYDHQNIVFASLTLWLLNLVLPAVIGLFLMYRIKLFNKEKV